MQNTKEEKIQQNIDNANKIFQSVWDDALDYARKEQEYGFVPKLTKEQPLIFPTEEHLKVMGQHPFTLFLRRNPNFKKAKDKVLKWQLEVFEALEFNIFDKYSNEFALERVCAFVIYLFTDSKNKLSENIVTADVIEEVTTAIEKLLFAFNKNRGMYFSSNIKQHLLQILLEDLLSSQARNIYSAKRSNTSILRQVFIKHLLQTLFCTYNNISIDQAVIITLDITGVFFTDVMDRSDLTELAGDIYANFKEELEFSKKTVSEILLEYKD